MCTTVCFFTNHAQAVLLVFGVRGVQTDSDIMIIQKRLENEIESPFKLVTKHYVATWPEITSFEECRKIDVDSLGFDTIIPPIISRVSGLIYPKDSRDPIGSQDFYAVDMYKTEDCTPTNDEDYPLQIAYERTWQTDMNRMTFFLRKIWTKIIAENGEEIDERQADLWDGYRSFKLITKDEFDMSKLNAIQVVMGEEEAAANATAPAGHVFPDYSNYLGTYFKQNS